MPIFSEMLTEKLLFVPGGRWRPCHISRFEPAELEAKGCADLGVILSRPEPYSVLGPRGLHLGL